MSLLESWTIGRQMINGHERYDVCARIGDLPVERLLVPGFTPGGTCTTLTGGAGRVWRTLPDRYAGYLAARNAEYQDAPALVIGPSSRPSASSSAPATRPASTTPAPADVAKTPSDSVSATSTKTPEAAVQDAVDSGIRDVVAQGAQQASVTSTQVLPWIVGGFIVAVVGVGAWLYMSKGGQNG